MKKLQNNFTTPEQSKRLLELGVPADSADCYINWYIKSAHQLPSDYTYTEFYEFHKKAGRIIQPCWSAGRLIEIYEICYAQEYIRDVGTPLMEDVLSTIYDAVNDTTEQWNFSKLEE